MNPSWPRDRLKSKAFTKAVLISSLPAATVETMAARAGSAGAQGLTSPVGNWCLCASPTKLRCTASALTLLAFYNLK